MILILTVLGPICSQGALLAYDTFDDYEAQNSFVNLLILQNSGIGLRGPWETTYPGSFFERADLYELVSPGLQGACKIHVVADDRMNVAVRNLEFPVKEGQTLFIRAQVKPDDFLRNDLSEFGLKLVFQKGTALAGKSGFTSNLGVGNVNSTLKAVAGTSYYFIIKVELFPDKDRLSLYVMQSLSTTEPTPVAVSSNQDYGNLERIGFSTRNATVSYDSLVVAETFDQVIFPSLPEPPKISWTQANVIEGNQGTNNHVITFSLSKPSSRQVSFSYLPFNMDHVYDYARAGEDFLPIQGEVIFPPGSMTQTLTLPIVGDASSEPDETIPLWIRYPVNAAFWGSLGIEQPYLLIKNDDTVVVKPQLTIERRTDGYLIQWNAGSGGNLEYAESLAPGSEWLPVQNYTTGQTYSTLVPFAATEKFFRTRKP